MNEPSHNHNLLLAIGLKIQGLLVQPIATLSINYLHSSMILGIIPKARIVFCFPGKPGKGSNLAMVTKFSASGQTRTRTQEFSSQLQFNIQLAFPNTSVIFITLHLIRCLIFRRESNHGELDAGSLLKRFMWLEGNVSEQWDLSLELFSDCPTSSLTSMGSASPPHDDKPQDKHCISHHHSRMNLFCRKEKKTFLLLCSTSHQDPFSLSGRRM